MTASMPAQAENRPPPLIPSMAHSPPQSSPFTFNHDSMQAPHEDEKRNMHGGFPLPTTFPPPSQAARQNGPVQMPSSPSSNLPAPARHRSALSMGAFEVSRSPPNPKSTSHVPCKFYKLGQCQAGKACPFSHTLESTGDEVCSYFRKGNCKFGQKCALAHVLPNGRRVNRPNAPPRGSMDFGGRLDPQLYSHQDFITSQALLAQQVNGGPVPFSQQVPPFPEHDRPFPAPGNRPLDNIPTIDTDYALPHYGSPPEPSRMNTSTVGHLRTLDAPLPASFDSQGISYIARHGPVAASLPTNLGPELSSPPSSSRPPIPSDGRNALQPSLAAQRNPRARAPELGSSPLTSGDEGPAFRAMHSQRMTKPKMLSASLPRTGMHTGDWEEGLYFSEGEETDFIPSSLHDQILTPQERMRRSSRNEQDNRSVRESLSGIGTPGDSTSKVGSPNTGSPASRYGAFFARRQQDANNNNIAGSPNFGPVGSPLRNIHPSASPSLRATQDASENSPSFPSFASPPRHSSMSILSQQLGRTRLSVKTGDIADKPSNLHPNSARQVSAPAIPGFGRTISSANRDRIEEEQGEGVFSLEEDVEVRSKRNSGGSSSNSIWGAAGMRKPSEYM